MISGLFRKNSGHSTNGPGDTSSISSANAANAPSYQNGLLHCDERQLNELLEKMLVCLGEEGFD